jgi:tetratricopeptide (TPR) repeat protein
MQSRVRPNDSEMPFDLSKVYWLKGMYKEAQQELEKSLDMDRNSKDLAAVHKAWLQGGEKAVEQWGANNLKAQAHQRYVPAWEIARAVAYTGDKDETLKYLEAAYREHSPSLPFMQTEAVFKFLHKDPRFQALAKRVGLTPVVQ